MALTHCSIYTDAVELSLRWTPLRPASVVCRREMSTLETLVTEKHVQTLSALRVLASFFVTTHLV